MQLIPTEALDIAIGNAGTGSASLALGPLHALKVDLFKADLNPDRNTVAADLIAAKCDYTGYAQGSCTFGAPSRADDGAIECVSQQLVFRPTDAVAPNDAYGLWCTLLGNTSVAFVGTFPNPPLPMQSALDEIRINIRWRPETEALSAEVS